MPTFKYGETYFSHYQGKGGVGSLHPCLVTVSDETKLSYNQAPSPDHILVEPQPYSTGIAKQFHWIDKQYLRYATAKDFEVGDIIQENTLITGNLEIVSIDEDLRVGSMIVTPPIHAEELDNVGIRGGNIFMLEPFECIMVDPVNEPTLDLGILDGPEPRNNDGRKRCYWCGGKTKHDRGFHLDWYDVCTQCGR